MFVILLLLRHLLSVMYIKIKKHNQNDTGAVFYLHCGTVQFELIEIICTDKFAYQMKHAILLLLCQESTSTCCSYRIVWNGEDFPFLWFEIKAKSNLLFATWFVCSLKTKFQKQQ